MQGDSENTFFEKQSKFSLQCGKHSINNLFQQHVYSQKDMEKICHELSKGFINPHKHILGGDYDANVLIIAVQRKGYQCKWVDKRHKYSLILRKGKSLKGFLINKQIQRQFHHKIFCLSARHWCSVIQEQGIYYLCDSQSQKIQKIGEKQGLQEYMNRLLNEGGQVIEILK